MKSIKSVLFGVILLTACLTGCGGGGGGGGDGSIATPNIPTNPQDTSKPVVNSSTPAHNSVGVGTNSAITLVFNEVIDPATINSQSFTLLKDGTTPIQGSIAYVGTTAQFKPAVILSANTSYTATVTTAVKDLAGNALAANYAWQFTTGEAPDSTSPMVLTTYPASNSMGVALNSAITVTFNEEIDSAAINKQTITLWKDGTIPVAGTVTYVGKTALFKPTGTLSAGTSYTATITTGVKDLAGNALAGPFTWFFTTGAASDTKGPEILTVSPLPESKNVPVDSAIIIFFNEPVMPFYYGLVDGRPIAVLFNDTYTKVTLQPTIAMKPGSTYATVIRLQDMAGNPMSAPVVWQFSTIP